MAVPVHQHGLGPVGRGGQPGWMNTFKRATQRLLRSRRLPGAGIGVTLLVLAGIVAYGTLRLRANIRMHIVSRDADIFHGVAQMVQLSHETDQGLGSELELLPDQLAVAMQISELNQSNGVIATRIFDTNGTFAAALPVSVAQGRLDPADLAQLHELRPLSRFQARARLSSLFATTNTGALGTQAEPLLRVLIPLHRQGQAQLLGVIEFIMDGRSVATRFAALDQSLLSQSILIFGASGIIVSALLSWAFRRLHRSNRLLQERTQRLLEANRELALSAKTSAVGAIAAHLVHGLSNPLAGLEEMVAAQARETWSDAEWQDAVVTTRQIKEMIGEVLRMLGEEQSSDRYEFSFGELAEIARTKVLGTAQAAGVSLHITVQAGGSLLNREGNLILLILENLLKNAIQASLPGGVVRLTITADGPDIAMAVQDQGPGIPAEAQGRLFLPRPSTKPGGHGVGLAICKQLAGHLGAKLDLQNTSAAGSTFVLHLPRVCLEGKQPLDPAQQMS